MQKLLMEDTFDSFLINEGEINTAVAFTMNGHINRNFYDSEDLSSINEDFVSWKQIKHIFFEIIRGKKVPTHLKLVFSFPKSSYGKIISNCGISLSKENISGLYLHVLYENNEVTVITGTSINIFTLDKTLDKYWDNLIFQFLSKHFNVQEI